MGTIVLWMQLSLDGFTAGPHGEFDWPVIGPQVQQYFNDELRGASTFMYGRRVYEMMAGFWPTAEETLAGSPLHVEYARIWKPMPKLVFSRTLKAASWNTTVVNSDLPGGMAKLRQSDDARHVLFGGADIASSFMRLDLIDEYRLFIHPVALGAGTSLFGGLDSRLGLQLEEERTFDDAVVHVRYGRTARRG